MEGKERFEVLLEEIRGDVKIIAEGLVSLRSEMERGFQSLRQELKEEIADLRNTFKLYAKQTDRRLATLEARGK